MNSHIYHIFILILYSTECLSQPSLSPSNKLNFKNDIPFNVDLDFTIQINNPTNKLFAPHRSPDSGSMFGASLAADNDIIFIGAPKMHSRSNNNLATGAVFRCESDLPGADKVICTEINFLNSIRRAREYTETNHSMVGYSMVTLNGNVVICAPTWATNSRPGRGDTDPSPEGICFEIKIRRPLDYPELLYFNTKQRVLNQRPYESHTMLGFSLISDVQTNSLMMGIPGFSDFAGGFAYTSGSTLDRSRNFTRSDSYGGYALALISSKEGSRYLAVGIPRPRRFISRVVFVDIDNNLDRVVNSIFSPIEGSGDYFGSVITTNDNRAKNHQDLFVGAPLHSVRGRRQTGRVYLYKNIFEKISSRQIDKPIIIQPKIRRPMAQFGSAIAVIDMNRDGFNDIVISAPYEENSDPESIGAIYFYHYDEQTLNLKDEIRIEPKNFGQKLRGFGFSIWTGSDFDKNGFNDLLIGSALSEDVTIFRAKPVVKLTTTMEFDRKGINMTDNSKCNGQNSCFRVSYCIFTDSKKKTFNEEVTYLVNFTVSDRKLRIKETRAILPKQNFIIKDRRTKICKDNQLQFYVEMKQQDEVYDIITPVEVELSVAIAEMESNRFCSHCPVARSVMSHKEINFEHGCTGKKCLSKLHLSANLRYGPENIEGPVVQGIYNNLELAILVKNTGEASIDTMVIIETNVAGLSLRNEETRCRGSQNANVFHCEVNRFLLKDQKEDFKILFDFENIRSRDLVFDLRLESKSDVTRDSIVRLTRKVSVIKEVKFKLIGDAALNYSFSSQTPDVSFPISVLADKTGPSRVNSTVVSFLLPYDIVDIDPISKYRCYQIDSVSTSITEKMLFNGTLKLPCEEQPEVCRRFECVFGAFKPGSDTQNFDISLRFQATEIPSKILFQRAFFAMEFLFFTDDPLIVRNKPLASFRSEIMFEKQATALVAKANPLIMIGGGSIGLIIILIAVFLLYKAGFFKRKTKEEMMKAKARQRMSMAPNAFENLPDQVNGS